MSEKSHSFEIGKAVIIRSVVFHYLGRVRAVTDSEMVLEEASWLADSGRWNEALVTGKLNETEPYPGPCFVSRDSILDWTFWNHPLPREVK